VSKSRVYEVTSQLSNVLFLVKKRLVNNNFLSNVLLLGPRLLSRKNLLKSLLDRLINDEAKQRLENSPGPDNYLANLNPVSPSALSSLAQKWPTNASDDNYQRTCSRRGLAGKKPLFPLCRTNNIKPGTTYLPSHVYPIFRNQHFWPK
jgi:hypothetical protein